MKLYAYCLAEGLDELNEPVRGINDAPVRLLKIEDLGVLVSDFSNEAVSVTRDNALNHAAVVRSILAQTTPLPFRFGTLVTEQQLTSYVKARKAALETKFAQVRGCVEMSVKIIWELPKESEVMQEETDTAQGAGALFLAAKRREIFGNEQRTTEAQTISDWLKQRVSGLTRDQQVTLRPSERLVLAAAHLVERAKIDEYRQRVAAARNDRPELHFLLSGPWPPYSFANIDPGLTSA